MSHQTMTGQEMKFVLGGVSGMCATVFVQPLDMIKNRLQLSGQGGAKKEYRGSIHVVASIAKQQGLFGMYNGLSAGLFRQGTYTTTRLGIYNTLIDRYSNNGPLPFYQKALIGMFAGASGAFVGTPAEVVLIRMTADGSLPVEQRRNYRHVFHALSRIVQSEGIVALWRGCMPTMARAMVLNAAQLATYSQFKQILLESGYFKDNVACHFMASMMSGLAATAASLPVDITKTRIQNMQIINGVPEYRHALDCFSKIIRHEGPLSLWKGFLPYFFRLGPHTVLTFILLEQMNQWYVAARDALSPSSTVVSHF